MGLIRRQHIDQEAYVKGTNITEFIFMAFLTIDIDAADRKAICVAKQNKKPGSKIMGKSNGATASTSKLVPKLVTKGPEDRLAKAPEKMGVAED